MSSTRVTSLHGSVLGKQYHVQRLHLGSSEELVKASKEMPAPVLQWGHRNMQGSEAAPFQLVPCGGSQTVVQCSLLGVDHSGWWC